MDIQNGGFMNEYEEVLTELRQQEEEIQFTSFSNDTALAVGMALLQEARKRGKPVTIDITRKNNVVKRFGHSSYYMGISLQNAGQTIEEKYLISSSDYAAHGGAFPLIIRGVGVVGTITVSGLPQQEDHELVVTTLKQFLANSRK